MKGFLITHKGMEDTAALEVNELTGNKSKINESCVVFDIKEYEDLFKLCYKSQSAIGVYYLLCEFNFNDVFKDFKKNIEKIKFDDWLNKNTLFRVKCFKNYEGGMSTPDIEKKLGEIIINFIHKKYGYNQKVNLNNPEITIFTYLTEKRCYVGIDFAGFELSKRSYNIFTDPASIRGTLGYFLVRLSEYNRSDTLLDPFSGSGTIPIEAAMFALQYPVNFFNKEKFIFLKFEKFKGFNFKKFFEKQDKDIKDPNLIIYNIDNSMKYLTYAKKNSKIAGIGKKMIFSRMDLEWMDTKFKKGQVDKIVAKFPSLKTKDIGKIYKEFFYQAEFILSQKGKIVLIGDKELIKNNSAKCKFKISDEKSVSSGKKEYEIIILCK